MNKNQDVNRITQYQIAGFWRRVMALLVDVLLLALIGNLLGLMLSDVLSSMGNWGRLLGFVLAGIYFTVMNSGLGQGQTLGKRVLKITLVDAQGKHISLIKSLLRYTLMAAPFFLSGIKISQNYLQEPWFLGLLFLILAPGLSLMYLIVFNRHTRQSLHDIVVGSYVIDVQRERQQPLQPIWKFHWLMVGVCLLIAAVLPYTLVNTQLSDQLLQQITANGALQQNPLVYYSEIQNDERKVKVADKPATNTRFVRADVYLKRDQIHQDMLAQSLAMVLIRDYPPTRYSDRVQIYLRYGFDIGIARKQKEMQYEFEVKTLLGQMQGQ